jgi:hypothetical protein
MIGEIPPNLDWGMLRRRLVEMRAVLLKLEKTTSAPRAVKNLTATAKAGGVIIQFTRTDGDRYVIYRNSIQELNGAVRFELGNTGYYSDDIGTSGQKRYYWVRAIKGSMESVLAGPVNATTLGLGVEITQPAAPPAVDEPVTSELYGYPTER